jgi:hypothetical protein
MAELSQVSSSSWDDSNGEKLNELEDFPSSPSSSLLSDTSIEGEPDRRNLKWHKEEDDLDFFRDYEEWDSLYHANEEDEHAKAPQYLEKMNQSCITGSVLWVVSIISLMFLLACLHNGGIPLFGIPRATKLDAPFESWVCMILICQLLNEKVTPNHLLSSIGGGFRTTPLERIMGQLSTSDSPFLRSYQCKA